MTRRRQPPYLPPVTLVLLMALMMGACAPLAAEPSDRNDPVPSPGNYFAFYSDPSINLHHFLYHWSRCNAEDLKPLVRCAFSDTDLSAAEKSTWAAALDAYEAVSGLDLLFDAQLIDLKWRLATTASTGRPTLDEALTAALPIYRRHWWPSHQETQRRLLELTLTELERHETAVAEALIGVLGNNWGPLPIRVDLVELASWAPAYTTAAPNHIIFSAAVLETSEQVLEMLFHEAAHSWPLGNRLKPAMDAALAQAGVRSPRLWHMVQFYAVGDTVARVTGNPDYVQYADREGLWRGRYGALQRAAIAAHWPAYVASSPRDLDAVLTAIALTIRNNLDQPESQDDHEKSP